MANRRRQCPSDPTAKTLYVELEHTSHFPCKLCIMSVLLLACSGVNQTLIQLLCRCAQMWLVHVLIQLVEGKEILKLEKVAFGAGVCRRGHFREEIDCPFGLFSTNLGLAKDDPECKGSRRLGFLWESCILWHLAASEVHVQTTITFAATILKWKLCSFLQFCTCFQRCCWRFHSIGCVCAALLTPKVISPLDWLDIISPR